MMNCFVRSQHGEEPMFYMNWLRSSFFSRTTFSVPEMTMEIVPLGKGFFSFLRLISNPILLSLKGRNVSFFDSHETNSLSFSTVMCDDISLVELTPSAKLTCKNILFSLESKHKYFITYARRWLMVIIAFEHSGTVDVKQI